MLSSDASLAFEYEMRTRSQAWSLTTERLTPSAVTVTQSLLVDYDNRKLVDYDDPAKTKHIIGNSVSFETYTITFISYLLRATREA